MAVIPQMKEKYKHLAVPIRLRESKIDAADNRVEEEHRAEHFWSKVIFLWRIYMISVVYVVYGKLGNYLFATGGSIVYRYQVYTLELTGA